MVIEIENQLVKIDYCYSITAPKFYNEYRSPVENNFIYVLHEFTLYFLEGKSVNIEKRYPIHLNQMNSSLKIREIQEYKDSVIHFQKIYDKVVDLWVNHKDEIIKIKI